MTNNNHAAFGLPESYIDLDNDNPRVSSSPFGHTALTSNKVVDVTASEFDEAATPKYIERCMFMLDQMCIQHGWDDDATLIDPGIGFRWYRHNGLEIEEFRPVNVEPFELLTYPWNNEDIWKRIREVVEYIGAKLYVDWTTFPWYSNLEFNLAGSSLTPRPEWSVPDSEDIAQYGMSTKHNYSNHLYAPPVPTKSIPIEGRAIFKKNSFQNINIPKSQSYTQQMFDDAVDYVKNDWPSQPWRIGGTPGGIFNPNFRKDINVRNVSNWATSPNNGPQPSGDWKHIHFSVSAKITVWFKYFGTDSLKSSHGIIPTSGTQWDITANAYFYVPFGGTGANTFIAALPDYFKPNKFNYLGVSVYWGYLNGSLPDHYNNQGGYLRPNQTGRSSGPYWDNAETIGLAAIADHEAGNSNLLGSYSFPNPWLAPISQSPTSSSQQGTQEKELVNGGSLSAFTDDPPTNVIVYCIAEITDVNNIDDLEFKYDEVLAIENTFGLWPQLGGFLQGGTFFTHDNVWGTLGTPALYNGAGGLLDTPQLGFGSIAVNTTNTKIFQWFRELGVPTWQT